MGTNTGIGIGIGIPFKNFSSGGRQPLPPDLKASLKGVWIAYGKSNNDADRSIVKNLVDLDNPFIISNAAFKLNSGFGKYEVDFTSWIQTNGVIASSDKVQNSITGRFLYFNTVNKKEDVPSFKVNITLGQQSKLQYNYIKEDGTTTYIVYSESGIYTIPASYFSKYTGVNAWFGFYQIEGTSIIEQIPSFEGAFVTDGVNDLITSTKTVQEMGVTDEITIVSMIHQIQLNPSSSITNDIRVSSNNTSSSNGRIVVSAKNKTGIYGWSRKGNTKVIITKILGDKNDYSLAGENSTNYNNKFSVVGTVDNRYNSSVAWYWTIIANKVLTTDQINQVIAYFNLDRTLKPDILCNVKKQGITNENHAEFGDRLIDFSGNGRDIQLNNIAWDGDSGIGKYNYPNWKVNVTQGNKYARIVYYDSINGTYSANFKGITDLYKSYGLSIEIRVNRANTINFHSIKEDGIYTITPPDDTTSMDIRFGGEDVYNASCNITITQIPSHAGAFCLDGVNDFGKVTGMPIYKDYTFIIEREFLNETFPNQVCLVSKSKVASEIENGGAFIVDNISVNSIINPYSFYKTTSLPGLNTFDRQIVFQSKYKYLDKDIAAGTATDSDTLWLGTFRDNDSRFANVAIYSLMTFPYSMSEFLIERQLKKHKLGTLYPDMVEFRPIVKSNSEYQVVDCYIDTFPAVVGNYYPINSKLRIAVTTKGAADEVTSLTVNGVSLGTPSVNGNRFTFNGTLSDKSPQKINITIDEYIRFEDIKQPYPVIFQVKDRHTSQIYNYGDKIKVGSSIQLSQGEKPNLLSGLYSIQSYEYEGKKYSYNQLTNLNIILTKQSISLSCNKIWLLDDNEPKCILSPRLLRIPNSSYKILGHIPDISGHGNHGKINNSAYAEGSGVNEDGSYQFDGVDDFVTIPTLSSGGKQVLMKVNLPRLNEIIYDQRKETNTYTFAILTTPSGIAYDQRNSERITYIDGILNTNIIAEQLMGVTHNIVVINSKANLDNTRSPILGHDINGNNWSRMRIYDFMLFDEISTDDKIKELNEYVGIEAKVELPPYYWDTYGKTNLDADKATIQQRGVAVGDYDLTNYNHAYEGMSGYNGYPVVFGAGKTWETLSSVYSYISDVTSTTIHVTMVKNAGTGLLFSYVKKDEALTNIKEIPAFRVTVKGLEGNSKFGYRYLATEDATAETLVYLGNGTHELAKSFAPTEALLDLTRNAWVGIFITPMVEGEVVFDCDITIEVLPEYENGLVYDGITDYSKNANIPALDDFTAIIKREWLKNRVVL